MLGEQPWVCAKLPLAPRWPMPIGIDLGSCIKRYSKICSRAAKLWPPPRSVAFGLSIHFEAWILPSLNCASRYLIGRDFNAPRAPSNCTCSWTIRAVYLLRAGDGRRHQRRTHCSKAGLCPGYHCGHGPRLSRLCALRAWSKSGVYFVTRARTNMLYDVVERHTVETREDGTADVVD
jgi:hypothetical protein